MREFFLKIFNMSISASWIILAVIVLRLLLKKAPKWINVLLWGIVAVRLICPLTFESEMSLIPSTETIPTQTLTSTPQINTGIPAINSSLNPIIQETNIPVSQSESVNVLQLLISIISKVWIIGIVLMLTYSIISYIRIRKKIGTAVLLRDNIYQSETVVSPFVLGIIFPTIYLPFSINEQNIESVIAHEQAHIKRKDYIWKPLGFLLLTLHWFNPLVWFGYILLCRDIELACDEKAIKHMNIEQRADYSQALLTCSVNRRTIAACPVAFGEVNVKNRIISVLNYKKPAFWIILIAIISSIVIAACFLTNPIKQGRTNDNYTPNTNNSIEISTSDELLSHNEGMLREKYPMYYDLDATNGLIVYIWQMAKDSYSCCLLPNNGVELTAFDLLSLNPTATTLEEMRYIVASYLQYMYADGISICPIVMPTSSYAYTIDEKYISEINELFWNEFLLGETLLYGNYPDSAIFDIDGDGINEECIISPGPTSGIYSFQFSVFENGELEYFNIYSSLESGNMMFTKNNNGDVKLITKKFVPYDEPIYYIDIAIVDGVLTLHSDELDLHAWGEQGADLPISP